MDDIGTGGRAGARVLSTDLRVAAALANDARHRAITRLFAVPADQQNLLTLVAILALAQSGSEHLKRMLAGPPLPSAHTSLLATSSVKELLLSVAGPPARDTPNAGMLLAIAIVGGATGPTVFRSLRGARAFSRRAATGFHHRYGYIVDPGHWRAQRALRRTQRSGAPAVDSDRALVTRSG
jgi:hypothetical protein